MLDILDINAPRLLTSTLELLKYELDNEFELLELALEACVSALKLKLVLVLLISILVLLKHVEYPFIPHLFFSKPHANKTKQCVTRW
jgi:hypothetical protein